AAIAKERPTDREPDSLGDLCRRVIVATKKSGRLFPAAHAARKGRSAMKTIALPSTLGLVLAVCLHASPAQAILQAFVSGNGSDGNNCTRTFPCRSFQAAHDAVNAGGGFINCLDVFDSSTNATFNISKSVTIDCTGVFAKILGPGGTLNAV